MINLSQKILMSDQKVKKQIFRVRLFPSPIPLLLMSLVPTSLEWFMS